MEPTKKGLSCLPGLTVPLIKIIDDSAKGGLTQFWELFTMIPCAPNIENVK